MNLKNENEELQKRLKELAQEHQKYEIEIKQLKETQLETDKMLYRLQLERDMDELRYEIEIKEIKKENKQFPKLR